MNIIPALIGGFGIVLMRAGPTYQLEWYFDIGLMVVGTLLMLLWGDLR